ncbi:hypothetical protein PFICI_11705 [Pestalotiopsis fici W106-1]|uniref:Uncharacterized protein n=1 Tax=Pestalotiopsis fici (strain W106-1 / CGMCC3.15140) TaxID=1229662 RepID=W3WR50_PESFW|nr:uncharacterized protein PFICI_11705 [Pestalotiopsis fici W106-1]ETS76318.1 hypothetical protein PFICI_11705 [Pestalotiopsis fici W106-1]
MPSSRLTNLASLLAPIGNHRLEHIKPSKGSRERKRKRKEAAKPSADHLPVVPPAPEIGSFVDVGLAVVTRSLESVVAQKPDEESVIIEETMTDETHPQTNSSSIPYSAVFVARSDQPSVLNSHLPQILAAASLRDPTREPIRLVGLSKTCQDRLSLALGIPRVSVIGLRKDAPNSKALVDFTCQHVPAIEVPWLKEAQKLEFRDTKINAIETFVGQRQKGKRGFGVSEKP